MALCRVCYQNETDMVVCGACERRLAEQQRCGGCGAPWGGGCDCRENRLAITRGERVKARKGY